jgi:UDP-N-acetylglucosamine 2-epimerase (non-hydrolysing)
VSHVLVPVGTRPEIIKLAPVVAGLKRASIPVRVVATGQHYDTALSDVFFRDLDLQPDDRWILDGDEPTRLARMTELAAREIAAHPPRAVLLLGDTNTVPIFCLAARRAQRPVLHLEAGLRSFNETSIEEVNRRVAAACASLHLAPTELARRLLLAEGIAKERIAVVGNPIVDLLAGIGVAIRPIGDRAGVLFTAHRASNVDNPERLSLIVDIACALALDLGPVTFPVHPRTASQLGCVDGERRLSAAGVVVRPPLPYVETLELMARSRVVVTDSGGMQEEAAYFGVPSVVMRRTTPRWEGVELGIARLVGTDAASAVQASHQFARPAEQARVAAVPCPYGDGTTGEQVARLLGDPATEELLALREPDVAPELP